MNVHSFGQHEGAPVFEATIASKAGADRQDSHLGRGAARSRRAARTGQAAGDARPQFDRGLRRPFAALRRGARPLRQPHRQRPLHARRRRAQPRAQARREAHAARRTRRLRAAGVEARPGRRVVGDARTGVARRRSGIPRRLARRLRLPIARAGDVTRRVHRDLRPADDRQSHPARLFQPRRLERRARPRSERS